MTTKKPKATDWQNRHIDDWNATTFRAYFGHVHESVLGIPYEPFRNWGVEMSMVKTSYERYGKMATKMFIDRTVREYKPSKRYPGTSFGFQYSYNRNVLQQIVAEQNEVDDMERKLKEYESQNDEIEGVEW